MSKLRDMIREQSPAYHVRTQIYETLKDFAACDCINRKRLVIRDRFTLEKREILVPCGKCNHCRMQKQNDWFSRMYLHTEYCKKHAYFVTLTYSSYDNYEDIPRVLLDAYWRKDSYNETKRLCYSPCLLRHEHFVRFMKYLRKIHGNDSISFFLGSEFGSTYGRPHMHVLLWSDEPISKLDICAAWSARVPKHLRCVYYTFDKKGKRVKHVKQSRLIGRVDFNDLNINGTIIADGINFGHDMHKCFMYVSKYCSKNFVDINNVIDQKARLNLFIDDIAHRAITMPQLAAVFNSRIRHMMSLYTDWADYFADYVREKEYAKISELDQTCKIIDKRKIYLDYETPSISYALQAPSLTDSFGELETVATAFAFTVRPCVFRKVFRPYCLASRSEGLGAGYLAAHIADYQQGKFNLPTYNGKAICVPSLFVRKVKESLYRFVQNSTKIISQSNPSNLLIAPRAFETLFPPLGCVRFDHLFNGESLAFNDESMFAKHNQVSGILSPTPTESFSYCVTDIDKICRSQNAFRDYRDGTTCIAYLDDDLKTIYIYKYKYDRKSKHYALYDTLDFETFMRQLYLSYIQYSSYYYDTLKLSLQTYRDYLAFTEDMELYCNSVFEYSYQSVLVSAYDDFMSSLRDREKRSETYNTNTKKL